MAMACAAMRALHLVLASLVAPSARTASRLGRLEDSAVPIPHAGIVVATKARFVRTRLQVCVVTRTIFAVVPAVTFPEASLSKDQTASAAC